MFQYLNVDLVRRSGDVLLVEPDPDGVLAGLLHRVAHVAGAVLPVLEVKIRWILSIIFCPTVKILRVCIP